MNQFEIRRTPEGKVLARRKDGRPLTAEDRTAARLIAQTEDVPLRAWIVKEISHQDSLTAVMICSAMLQDHLWLILDRSFVPADGIACYFAEELPELKTKTLQQLREIHRAKLAFPGCRVIQEGAETRVSDRKVS